MRRLLSAKRMQLRQALLGVVANALHYNAPLALAHMRGEHLQPFFLLWSEVRVCVAPCGALCAGKEAGAKVQGCWGRLAARIGRLPMSSSLVSR